MRERRVVVGGCCGGVAVEEDGEGEGELEAFCLSASSRISVSVRRSIMVFTWWVVDRFAIAAGEAVAGRAER